MAIGSSTTQTPYLVATASNVTFTSVVSAGDAVAGSNIPGTATPWRMVGTPDGIGAFDNGDGTFSILFNHELTNAEGTVRAHGSIGSFVDRLVVDKTTLKIVSAGDLVPSANDVFTWDSATSSYVQGTTAWTRFCSSDLPAVSAIYDATTGLGTQNRLYFTGEEAGPEGRPFAFVASGPDQGKAYEIPRLGNMAFENIVLNPNTGAKTIAMMQDDQSATTAPGNVSQGGQVYVYAGDKQATGTDVDKAGLNNGKLYGIVVPALGTGAAANETVTTNFEAGTPFTVAAIGNDGDVSGWTGSQIQADSEAKGVAEFLRPEDGAWDTINPNRYYFHTTDAITSPSRLWALDFVDAKDPTKGGTLRELLNGTEGQVMLDNMTVTADGHVIALEDTGNNPRLGKVWDYNPATDTLTQLAEHDPARFSGITPPFTQDEESSGVLDVTSILGSPGKQAFLIDSQAHYAFGDPTIVEGGQLMVMYVDRTVEGTSGADTLEGTNIDDAIFGREGDDRVINGAGDDLIDGGVGVDTVVFHSRFTDVHFTQTASGLQISGPEGVDTLRNVERLEFSDSTISTNGSLLGRTDTGASSVGVRLYELYDGLLGRTPDASGFGQYAAALDGGTSFQTVAAALLYSPEYSAKNGPVSAETNKGFVDELYHVALGRDADSDGEAHYVGLLDSGKMTRADVALDIATSPENFGQVSASVSAGVFVADPEAAGVARLYYGLLDRAPDTAGVNDYRAAVESGRLSLTGTASAILSSPEYLSANSGLTDEAFVRSLYDHALDRTADSSGLSHYLGLMSGGGFSRAQVAVDITQSAEAQNHLAPAIQMGWHV